MIYALGTPPKVRPSPPTASELSSPNHSSSPCKCWNMLYTFSLSDNILQHYYHFLFFLYFMMWRHFNSALGFLLCLFSFTQFILAFWWFYKCEMVPPKFVHICTRWNNWNRAISTLNTHQPSYFNITWVRPLHWHSSCFHICLCHIMIVNSVEMRFHSFHFMSVSNILEITLTFICCAGTRAIYHVLPEKKIHQRE